MKKLLVILLIILGYCGYTQEAFVSTLRVSSADYVLTYPISVGNQIFNEYNNELYKVVCALDISTTLQDAIDRECAIMITDYDRLTDSYISMFQGVRWNAIDNTYQRTGSLIDVAVSQSAGDSLLPIHSQMKRCGLDDYGFVQFYVDPDDPYLDLDGDSVDYYSGTYQIMVQIPKFYYRIEYNDQDDRFWNVSLNHLPGFTLHPAFFKDDQEVNYRYYSAFEGSMWDASTDTFCLSTSIATNMYASGDKMCSAADQWIKTYESRAEYRTMAAERGDGWRQLDFTLNAAVQLLYIVEYANLNTQNMIGMGRTSLSGGTWEADSYIGQTGMSIQNGNGTNSVSNGGVNYDTDYMTYRGIENWYGNVYKMIDGLTIDGRWIGLEAAQPVYWTNNSAYFKDEGRENMMYLCEIPYIGSSAGYISDFVNNFGFFPSEIGSSSFVGDYYYQYSESTRNYWRVPLVGGYAQHGSKAGGFMLAAAYAWSSADASYGARLCF